jgi:5'-3' exonuclease
MVEVFKYTERVVNMARPRKVLMMAIGEHWVLLPVRHAY